MKIFNWITIMSSNRALKELEASFDDNKKLRGEVESLRAILRHQIRYWCTALRQMNKSIRRKNKRLYSLREENKIMVEALEFYAKNEHRQRGPSPEGWKYSTVHYDNGTHAASTLEKINEGRRVVR